MNSAQDAELEVIRDLLRRHRFGQALVACNDCEAKWGNTADLLWMKATAHFELGDLGEAEQLLRRYLKLDPASVAGTKRLAEVLRMAGKQAAAITLLEGVVAQRKNDALLSELAQSHLEAGNSDLAILHANRALEENADSFQAMMVMGAAFVLLGAPSQALKQLESARNLCPSDYQVYVNMAAAYELLGDSGRRIASLERALLCESGLLPVRRNLAYLYRETGDIQAEAAQWEAICALGDQSVEARFELALAKRQLGEVQAAADILLDLAGQQRDSLRLWNELAACYVLLSEFVKARRVAEQVLSMDPQNTAALTVLAQINSSD